MTGVLLGAGRRSPPLLLAGVEFGQEVLRKASQSNYREGRNLAKQVRKVCVCREVGEQQDVKAQQEQREQGESPEFGKNISERLSFLSIVSLFSLPGMPVCGFCETSQS